MPDVKWIKLSTGLRTDAKISKLRRQKNGDSIALIWVLLLCMAGDTNDQGLIYISSGIPYEIPDLAAALGVKENIVSLALEQFSYYGMIDILPDHTIQISNWDRHQNISRLEKMREISKKSSKKYRDSKRHGDMTVTSRVTSRDATDKKEEEDIEEDKEKKREYTPKTSVFVVTPTHAPAREDGDDEPDFDTIEVYASNNLMCMSYGNMQELNSFRDDFTEDVIRFAIDCATGRGIRKWAYVKRVLSAWLDAGVKTLGDAKVESEKHAAKSAPAASQNYTQREYVEDEFGEDFYYDPAKDYPS